MEIQELSDIRLNIDDYHEYQGVELLEYVCDVANHFIPSIEGCDLSKAPAIFYERYQERNLSVQERYERNKEFYISSLSFDEYLKYHSDDKPLKDSFKERYLNSKELQDTIAAFGLDVSKLWYLLLFVHDYIEDIGNHSFMLGKSTLDDFNGFVEKLSETTSIVLKKDNRKRYTVDKEDTIKIIQSAVQYYIRSYNNIVNSDLSQREIMEQLNNIGGSVIDSSLPIDFGGKSYLDISYKKWMFAEMFLYFLKDKKATVPKNSIYNVSKDKLLFISRLIYVVGYDTHRYYDAYDSEGNPNRMLSNLLRRYKKENFPAVTGYHYML